MLVALRKPVLARQRLEECLVETLVELRLVNAALRHTENELEAAHETNAILSEQLAAVTTQLQESEADIELLRHHLAQAESELLRPRADSS